MIERVIEVRRYQDPPRNTGDDLADVVRALSKEPGRWAVIAEQVHESVFTDIVDSVPYEVEVRKVLTVGRENTMGARYDVYARFVPGDGR